MRKEAILRKKLHKSGIDGLLITDLNNLRYITGFTGSAGFLIITKKHSLFVTDFRYKEQAHQEIKGFKIIIQTAEKTKTIKKISDEYAIKKLGFEDHSVSYSTYKSLLKKGIRLKALTNVVEDLRLIKSAKELFYIKTAVKRAESAFKKLMPFVKAGVTEQELAVRLEGFLKEAGCKTIPFGVIIASGPMSAFPHARPASRRLKKGDLVLFDWGGECEGYYSDMSRMAALKSRGMSRQHEICSMVIKAQEAAIKAVKHGTSAKIIDKAARDFIKLGGYGDYFGHGTGHGVGLSVHEAPVISCRNNEVIETGMVFTVEPGIYIPGMGGARIEDMVAVSKNGAEVLTSLPRKVHMIDS
ncbi:MAG: aminopeptidase P family protein [Nitrospirae bacterium]|nr:aminopeptidase P family protein [Nitrospirota bacterium]